MERRRKLRLWFLSVFQECVDIDECVDLADACVANSVCINTVVSSCLCLSQWR